MRYIRFVFICAIIMLSLLSVPAYCSIEEKAMIYYSKETLKAGDSAHLEQGYSFKLMDANERSGDILVQIYYNDKEIEAGYSIGNEKKPLEYMITIEEKGKAKGETDYVVIRIRPVDFDNKNDGLYVEMEIEQFLDPEQEDNDFLLLDTSKSVIVGESLFLEEGYSLEASDMKDSSVVLKLSKDDRLLKEEKLEIDDIFSYSKNVDDSARTIFIARIGTFFRSSASSIVILKDVIQRPDMEEDDTERLSENESNNNELLIPAHDADYNVENNNTIADEQNGSKTNDVRTDHFIPILFFVIVAIGVVIFKLS